MSSDPGGSDLSWSNEMAEFHKIMGVQANRWLTAVDTDGDDLFVQPTGFLNLTLHPRGLHRMLRKDHDERITPSDLAKYSLPETFIRFQRVTIVKYGVVFQTLEELRQFSNE